MFGEVRKDHAGLLRQADSALIKELRGHDLYDRTSHAFAAFLTVRSIGIKRDGRRYDYVVSVRVVETVDSIAVQVARARSCDAASGRARLKRRTAIGWRAAPRAEPSAPMTSKALCKVDEVV
jgi:GMP synthase PP-ATPase subunit